MLNFEEFQVHVSSTLAWHLPDNLKDAKIALNEVKKNNGLVLHGITVCPKDSIVAPNIYLERYYDDYASGRAMDAVLDDIARSVSGHVNTPDKVTELVREISDFETVKGKIIMSVCNTEWNKEFLENVPHTEREDLSLVYRLHFGNTEDGQQSALIHNHLMEDWGVTKEQIHELAMKNTREILPPTVQTMGEVIKSMFGYIPDDIDLMVPDMPPDQQIYVISNTSYINGAVSMFYEDVLADLSKQVGTNLYILPSSTHEVIAVSANMGNPAVFAGMVREVNTRDVSPQEQLSNHVYYYDAGARMLQIVKGDFGLEETQKQEEEKSQNAADSQKREERMSSRRRRDMQR
ncbi:MAG: DUF5688 family protein [Clostridiaceae bacterium]|nr:DUF5688 family protein [Clostridiaceae bacterium]